MMSRNIQIHLQWRPTTTRGDPGRGMHAVWTAFRTSLTSRQHNMEDGDTIDAHLQQVSPFFTCFASPKSPSTQNDAVQKHWVIPLQVGTCGFTGTVVSGVERVVYGLDSTVQSLVHETGSGRQVELVSGPRTPYQSSISLCNLVTASRSR